ncbi:hypothetical protein BVX94_00465 [bacterium B17]|nr:hypothetical protein BVX94_00465 [bacterium B17]
MKHCIFVIALVFVLAGASYGHVREIWEPDLDPAGISWDESQGSPSNYFSNGELVYRIITGGTYAVTSNSYQLAIEHAAQTWEDIPDAAIAFKRGADIENDSDEDFSIGFSTEDGDTHWGENIAGVAALTTLTYIDFTNAYYIYNTDVSVNVGENPTLDGSNYFDLERTVMHEFGHVIGLSHAPHSMCEMSYVTGWNGTNETGNTEGRRLTDDDKLGAIAIYPTSTFSNYYGQLVGSVTLDGDDVHMAQVAAYNSDGIVVAVTLSYQGSYYFEALPAGTYTIKAFETFSEGDGLHHLYGYFGNSVEDLGAPDPFMTTEEDDVTDVEVSAGTFTAQDITVAEGTSSMKVLYSLAEGETNYNARAQVLRIKRGESLAVGIVGTNLPTSAAVITDLSISGSGVTISDTDVSEVTDEGLEGLYQLFFTVTVDSDAVCGPRDLSLTTLSYSDERYLVFGFLDIYDDPVVTVDDGPSPPDEQSYSTAETNVVMAHFNLSCDEFDGIRIREIQIWPFGTGGTTGVSEVRLYLDENSDGAVSVSDTLIGSGLFGADGTVKYSYMKTVPAGSNYNFLVTYDFESTAMGTYSCSIESGGTYFTGLYSSTGVSPSGLPYRGVVHTVNLPASIYLSNTSLGNDFSGDRTSDMTVYDGNTGYWYSRSLDGDVYVYGLRWGWPGAVPVGGDYDGDGLSDLALFDDLNGLWYVFTLDGMLLAWAQEWGWAGATPVAGDYDGDGSCDLAVYDDATGFWYVMSVDGRVIVWAQEWGWPGALPVSGDYDADGVSDLAVYDSDTSCWYIYSLSEGVLVWEVAWGLENSIPVPGDYNGDGYSDMAVFDLDTGYWFVVSLTGEMIDSGTVWGWSESVPVPGDYDGDGVSDYAVYYDEDAYWYITTVDGEVLAWEKQWGGSGYVSVSM